MNATPTGARHITLWHAAASIGELVAGGELDGHHAETMLRDQGRSLGLPESDVRKTVRRGLDRGEQKPRCAPEGGTMLRDRAEAIAEVIGWWAAVSSAEWHGEKAATDLRILAAFALLGLRAGKVRLSESYREIAEVAGVSVGAVSKHRAALAPWVRLVERGGRFTGTRSTWQLVRATGNSPATPDRLASGLFPNARTITDPAHPLWHAWSTGWRIACLLDLVEVSSARDLAAASGLHPGSVRRILARLEAAGVARRDPSGWVLVAMDTVVDAIVDFVAERHQRHVEQRIVHRRWLAYRLANPQHRRRRDRDLRNCGQVAA